MRRSTGKRATPEADLQIAVFKEARRRLRPDAFIFHVPNGGYRSVVEAKRLKEMGVVAGVLDVGVIIDGRIHFLELKAGNARLSDAQLFMMRRLREVGAPVAVAYSLEEALGILAGWGAFKQEADAA